jgi:hypothetical protein
MVPRMLNKVFLFCLLTFISLFSYSANIVINPITGFSDNTATSAIGGNHGLTLGVQRLNTFQKAADILETFLNIQIDIKVDAAFSGLACSSDSAILGSAGATGGTWNFPNAPIDNTIYPIALANNLANSDTNSITAEISATFNASMDNNANCLNGVNWYYGYDDPATAGAQYSNDMSFLSVAIHEILHGLGVSSWVLSNGALNAGLMDAYSSNLYDQTTSKNWGSMSNSERLNSMTNTNNLVWSGANVNNSSVASALTNGLNSGKVEMYAPSPYESGSSVSHFSKDATPNEIMEPGYTEFLTTPGMATQLLQDMGWAQVSAPANNAPVLTSIGAQTTTEDSTKIINLAAADADGDPVTYSASSNNSSVTTSISGNNLTLTPAANYFGSVSITVSVSDGTDSDSETFVFTVNAINDAPIFTNNDSVTTLYGDALVHTLSASDADFDDLSFDLISYDTSQITASLTGTTLTLQAINNFTGNCSIQVSVSDGTVSVLKTIYITIFDDFSLTSNAATLTSDTALTITNNNFNFSLNGGDDNYSINVIFNGKNVTHDLLTSLENSYQLGMPSSGAFAGEYKITITDSHGESADFTIKRPLKITTNINQLITASNRQEIYIEGAPAGSIVDLHINQGADLVSMQVNNVNISQVITPDNATNFNRTTINLAVNDATENKAINISADSVVLPTGSIDLTSLAFHNLALKIHDLSTSANININDDRFPIWGLPTELTMNNPAELILSLPNDQATPLIINAEGYHTKTLAIDAELDQLEVTLELLDNPTTISGNITTSSLDFVATHPLVQLISDDESVIPAKLTNINSKSVSYSVTMNKETFTAKLLRVTQGESVQEVYLLNNQSDSIINVHIEAPLVINVDTQQDESQQDSLSNNEEPIIVSAASAGSSLLLLLSLACLIKLRIRKIHR